MTLDPALLRQVRRVSADPAYSPTRHVDVAKPSAPVVPPARSCQFPVSSTGRRHVLCLAVPVVTGRPYCPLHCAIAYVPEKHREREDARLARAARPHMLGPAPKRGAGVEHVTQDF